jgi:hypothetical protein
VGDDYAVAISYSDGSSETIHFVVNAVLDCFPENLSATGDPAVPTFVWNAPLGMPASYTYFFTLQDLFRVTLWNYAGPNGVGFPSGTSSLLYNLDGKANPPTLTGTPFPVYPASLTVRDSGGNQAEVRTNIFLF